MTAYRHDLIGVGFPVAHAELVGELQISLAGAGTTQGAAASIGTNTVILGTPTAGATGFRLPTVQFAKAGATIEFYNRGAVDANLYPHVGGSINSLATNGAITVPPGSAIEVRRVAADLWLGDLDSFFSPNYIDARQYGVSASVTDNGPLINNAIAALPNGRGIVELPAGTLSFSTTISLAGKTDVLLRGQGGETAGASSATLLSFTGTGSGKAIDCTGAIGVWLTRMYIIYQSASFTGTLIYFGYPSAGQSVHCGMEYVTFGGTPHTTDCYIDLNNAQDFTLRNFASFGASGRGAVVGPVSGQFCSTVKIQNGEFNNGVVPAIANAGDSWNIDGVIFERLIDGTAGAYRETGSHVTPRGLSFTNACWFGDVTVSGGTWIATSARSLALNNCVMGGNSATPGTTIGVALTDTKAFDITGNTFTFVGTVVSLAGACTNGITQPNDYQSCGLKIYNPSAAYAQDQRIAMLEDFGAAGNGTTDDTAPIQSALTTFGAAGGGILYALNNYLITSTLTMKYPNVQLLGAGTASSHDVGTLSGRKSKFIASGAAWGPMLLVAPDEGASAQVLDGITVSGINLIGGGLITTCFQHKSVKNSRFDFHAEHSTAECVILGTSAVLGEGASSQRSRYHLDVNQNATGDGVGIYITGIGGGLGNFSKNNVEYMNVRHRDATGIVMDRDDSNIFYYVNILKAGGGSATYNLEFRGSNDATPGSRSEKIIELVTNGAWMIRGTTSYTIPCTGINVFARNTENATPAPTVETGATYTFGSDDGIYSLWSLVKMIAAESEAMARTAYALGLTSPQTINSHSENHLAIIDTTSGERWSIDIANATGNARIRHTLGGGSATLELPSLITILGGAVTSGAADSGGAGFKFLRIPN